MADGVFICRPDWSGAAHAEKIARIHRWNEPNRARVVHPEYGEIIVPCGSPLMAIECAAEKWGIPWTEISKEAEVWKV